MGRGASGRPSRRGSALRAGWGATVGAFRLLLERLGVRTAWARAFTLVFALSATQVLFSSLPETHAFSALGLVLVFLVATPPARSPVARLAAGVFSFGITATGLVAAAFAHLDWRRDGRRAPLVAARAVVLILLVAAALALLQQALFPGARPFFVREPLGTGYTSSVVRPWSLRELSGAHGDGRHAHDLRRHGRTPREGERIRPTRGLSHFASPLPALRPAGAIHVVLWAGLVGMAAWGLRRRQERPGRYVIALMGGWSSSALCIPSSAASLFLSPVSGYSRWSP